MKTDVQIAQQATLLPITQIAQNIGIHEDELDCYGKYKGKISLSVLKRLKAKENGKLILVTATNPTPAGEGKTTVNVGLSMALNKLGKKAVSTLREPSLGPCFGMKGGAAGGGYAQVVPMEDINLHFTGDFHAITSAHNLLAAMVDNHLHHENTLQIHPKRVVWKRVMDMNDRALRNIMIGLGNTGDGITRQSGFDITVASEIMAILCLATSLTDLKERLSKMIVAYSVDAEPITAGQLGAVGAMALLLKDAICPNLVQTLENTPAIIHGGPFANIAHGCNSVLATKTAMKLFDYTVTEAGFGADLGAEKFFDIKCPALGLSPDAVVLVSTIKALKLNGGINKAFLQTESVTALREGLCNLVQHIENLQKFGVPVVVALNRFPHDTETEIALVKQCCAQKGVDAVLTSVFADGGEGGLSLAQKVVDLCEMENANFQPLYTPEQSIEKKIRAIATQIYRANNVVFSAEAKRQLAEINRLGLSSFSVCMAKTQYSFSDDPNLLGAPRGFDLTVRELRINAGAGFIVAITGQIMTMPGLPKVPAACSMDISEDGKIVGLS